MQFFIFGSTDMIGVLQNLDRDSDLQNRERNLTIKFTFYYLCIIQLDCNDNITHSSTRPFNC